MDGWPQVLDGGENLLEVVDKLTAEAAAQEAALQAQKAAEAASLSRIAQLEEEHMHIEEQYSSVQVIIITINKRFPAHDELGTRTGDLLLPVIVCIKTL